MLSSLDVETAAWTFEFIICLRGKQGQTAFILSLVDVHCVLQLSPHLHSFPTKHAAL